MFEDSPAAATALGNPTVIDAHLMFAALDAVAVVLRCGEARVAGRFDLADGFGEVGFIDQSPDASLRLPLRDQVSVEYYFEGADIYRFNTRVIGQTAQDRYRLARPLRVSKTQRRSVPRFRLMGQVDYTFAFDSDAGPMTGELADLSNLGACLLISRSAGLERGGQRVDGWLRLREMAPVPVTVEVRHVAPYDAGRVAVGVRFVEIRPLDRIRLTRHLVELPVDPAA